MRCVTYHATEKDPSLRPYAWYKELVIAGALENSLPDSYIKQYMGIDAADDSCALRQAENAAILLSS
jgi:hypothetical protein